MKTFGSSIVASLIVVGCFAPHLKAEDREHLGKWHDAPRHLAIGYVCEKADLDGCSEAGWSAFEGSCYAFIEEQKSYDDAAAACEAQTAQLVSIQSAEENAHVQSLCKRHACWFGLSEPADSENWFWPDGTAAGTKGEWSGYTNWDMGEPNNWMGIDEDATFMNFWGYLDMPSPIQEAGGEDPMAAMMKYATPNDHHAHLAKLIGNWKSHSKFWMQPGAEPTESDGKAEISKALGGRYIQTNLSGTFMGMPFEGYGMDGFDIHKGKHIGMWTDTMGTKMMTYEGECSEGGKVTMAWSEFDDPMSGMHTKMKTVTTVNSDDQITYEIYITMPDGNEMKVGETVFTRL